MIYSFQDRQVTMDPSCFVAPDAVLIGSVHLEPESSIWFKTIVRADNDLIHIGWGTNIQDGSVLHTDEGLQLTIGPGVTVGHKAVLHGCQIGENCLIGINAVILNGARIGANCLIGAGALIPEGKEIEPGSVVLGSPGKVTRQISDQEMARIAGSSQHYKTKAAMYQQRLHDSANIV